MKPESEQTEPGIDSSSSDLASDEGYAGVALDLIEACLVSVDHRMILNIPNRRSIPAMAADDMVEIPAIVSRDKIEAA